MLKPEGLEPEGFLSKSRRLDPEVPLNLGGVRPEVLFEKTQRFLKCRDWPGGSIP